MRNLAKYIVPNYESTKIMFFKIPKFCKITILLVLIRSTYTQIGFSLQCTLKIFEFTKNKSYINFAFMPLLLMLLMLLLHVECTLHCTVHCIIDYSTPLPGYWIIFFPNNQYEQLSQNYISKFRCFNACSELCFHALLF